MGYTKETIPPGNEFHFSDNNEWLNNGRYGWEEIPKPEDSERLMRIARGVKKLIVREGWNFASAAAKRIYSMPNTYKELALVYIHPDRTDVRQVQSSMDYDFNALTQSGDVLEDRVEAVNKLFKGTGFMTAYISMPMRRYYNLIEVDNVGSKSYWQTGVGIICIYLAYIDHRKALLKATRDWHKLVPEAV